MHREAQNESVERNEWLYKNLTKNKKHTQEWKEYNEAQTKEKLMFYKLLNELLNVIPKRIYILLVAQENLFAI